MTEAEKLKNVFDKFNGLVCLHTDKQGLVWFATSLTSPQSSGMSVDEFCESLPWRFTNPVAWHTLRVAGCVDNAELIWQLAAWWAPHQPVRFHTCPPPKTTDVAQLLRMLRDGESYPFGVGELKSYDLIRQGQTEASKTTEFLQQHPVWPVLSFVRGFNEEAALKVLTKIVDPRWYSHPLKPHRATKLYRYLGVTPTAARRFLHDSSLGHPEHAAFEMWYHSAADNFVQKSCLKHADPVVGILRATQSLLSILRAYWAIKISNFHPDSVFMPKLAFRDPDDAAAFERHVESCVK